MHSGAAEVPHRAALNADAKHDDDTARLILAKEVADLAADNDSREHVLIALHVDPHAVACITLHIYLSGTHCVSGGVAAVAVNYDSAVVHGVAGGVLGVAVNADFRAVEVRAQRIAGGSLDEDFLAGKTCADISLSQHVLKREFLLVRVPAHFIQLCIQHILCVYDHLFIPPSFSSLRALLNIIICGLSFSISISTSERSMRSFIIEV